jgi:UbiD family decarboxylase
VSAGTAPASLRAFLDLLRRERDLVEVSSEVDPRFEVAEIHRRVVAAGGPALLFLRVRGHDMPVVTNLFGSARRVEQAFGRNAPALIARAADLPRTLMPPTAGRLWRHGDLVPALL